MNARFAFRFAVLSAVLMLASGARAQDEPGAKRLIILSGFAGFTHLTPDYGPYSDHGFLLGADVGRPFHHFVGSIDSRYTYATGQGVGESSILFGPKAEKRFGRINPYADFLFGYGMFKFTHPADSYTHDNSVVYDAGGGLDVDVTRSISVKGDLQYQSWQLGSEDNRMMPVALSVGVTYHVRSKPHWGRE